MRQLGPNQRAVVEAQSTEPNYLIEIDLEETHYWSTRDVRSFLGNVFEPGFVSMGRVANGELSLSFWNGDYQYTESAVDGGFLRNGIKVWWAYGEKDTARYVEEGYWEEGYVEEPGTAPPAPILIFDGFIYSTPRIDQWIDIIARPTPPKFYPDRIIRRPIANFLPSPGYSIEFDGAILQIEE